MQPLESVAVDATFRERVLAMVDRLDPESLGGVHLVVAPRWQPFVDALMLGERTSADQSAAAVVVGPPAIVLRHASTETNEFGFVMPVAQMARPWQRARQWRDDATLDVWRAGWSPLALDRLLVAGDDAIIEFVIGNVRRTPAVAGADA